MEIRRTTGSEGFARAVNVGLTALESRGCSLALVLNDDPYSKRARSRRCVPSTEADAIAPVLDEPHGLVYGIHVSRWGRVRLAMHPGPVQALSGAALLLRSTNALMSNTDTGSRTSSSAVVSPSADFGCASSSAPAVRMPLGQRSGARHRRRPAQASTDTCATSGGCCRRGGGGARRGSGVHRGPANQSHERARPGRGGLPQGPSASERAFAVLMAGARPGSRRIR